MNRFLSMLIAICLVFALSVNTRAQQTEEVIFYRNEGAYSSFSFTEVSIQSDGLSKVVFKRYNEDEQQELFKLNRQEMEGLKKLILESNFFSLSDQETTMIKDIGLSQLKVSLNDKSKDLKFYSIDELKPVINSLWKIINQAVILKGLQEKGEVYPVSTALSPRAAGAKVFQPEVFKTPLMRFIKKTDDRQKIIWGFEALSGIMIPEEWVSFLSKEIDASKGARKALLLEALSSHPFTGNVSNMHKQALLSLLLKNLELGYGRWPQFSKEEKDAFESIIGFLGFERYIPAAAVLVSMLQEPYSYDVSWLKNSLALMGMAAIKPLEHLLKNPNSEVRATASDMLGEILRANPDWPVKGTVSEEEQERILNTLKTSIFPKLKDIANKDPDDSVRKAAKRSLEQINQGWRK